MRAAANFAFANRQLLTHWTREIFELVLGRGLDHPAVHFAVTVPGPALGLAFVAEVAMTFLLICSSVTMVKALEWLGKGDRTRCKLFLFYTALGGAIFSLGTATVPATAVPAASAPPLRNFRREGVGASVVLVIERLSSVSSRSWSWRGSLSACRVVM